MKRLEYAIVFVSDMSRGVAFYRDTLGFPLKFESPHWSEFANDGSTLALHPAEPTESVGSPRAKSRGTCQLGFVVPDLDAFHRRMQAEGVRCLQPPTAEEFGLKLALYADPDGLPFSVVEAQRTS